MAQLQNYEGGIAPPVSTGEVLDTQSAQLAQQKAQAVGNVWNSAANVATAAGSLFEKIGAMGQQAQLTERLDTYAEETRKIMNMLNQTPTAIGSWAPDETGNRGDLFERWQQNQMSKLSEGLRGKYAQEFEHQVRRAALETEAGIAEFALTRQREEIAAKDLKFFDDTLSSPDTANPDRWVNRTMTKIEERFRMGLESGVYTETQAAQGIMEAQGKALQSVYGAITADIQDGNGWNHPTNPRVDEEGNPAPYMGINGALDYIADLQEADKLNPAQAEQMTQMVDEQDRIRASRGSNIQSQMSMQFTQDWMKRILVDGERPSMATILNDPRINPEVTDNYYRNGDVTSAKYITGILGDLLNPDTKEQKWDWDTILPLAGGLDLYNLHNDTTIDDVGFREKALRIAENNGLPPMATQWVLDKSRDRVFNDNYSFARNEVEAFYKTALDSAKNEEERIEIERQMAGDVAGILEGIQDPDIVDRADIVDVLRNYKTRKIGETIFKEYSREDPRKLNAAETVLKAMEMGEYRGLTYIPRFAEEAAQVGELHRQMVADIYGEDSFVDIRWGDKGTNMEGRVAFKVRDSHSTREDGSPREIWVMAEMEGNEEVFKEFDPELYDPRIGEKWNPAMAPVLKEMETRRVEEEEEVDGTIQGGAELGATWDEFLDLGYTPQQIEDALGGDTSNLPGAPDYIGDVPKAVQFYNTNASNGKLPYAMVSQFASSNNFDDKTRERLFHYIWTRNKDSVASFLQEQEKLGEINIVGNRGRRTIADGVLRRRIAEYGLPPEFTDRVYEYTFAGNETEYGAR